MPTASSTPTMRNPQAACSRIEAGWPRAPSTASSCRRARAAHAAHASTKPGAHNPVSTNITPVQALGTPASHSAHIAQ